MCFAAIQTPAWLIKGKALSAGAAAHLALLQQLLPPSITSFKLFENLVDIFPLANSCTVQPAAPAKTRRARGQPGRKLLLPFGSYFWYT
jgi:hypothetical protein